MKKEQRDEGHLLCFPSPVAHGSFGTAHPDQGIPKAPRRAQISVCTHTAAHIHARPRTWTGRSHVLLSSPGPSRTRPSQHPELFHPTPFQTRPSVMLEHETHRGRSDFCSYVHTLPRSTTPSLPAAAGKERTWPSREQLQQPLCVGFLEEVTKHMFLPQEHPEPRMAPPGPTGCQHRLQHGSTPNPPSCKGWLGSWCPAELQSGEDDLKNIV